MFKVRGLLEEQTLPAVPEKSKTSSSRLIFVPLPTLPSASRFGGLKLQTTPSFINRPPPLLKSSSRSGSQSNEIKLLRQLPNGFNRLVENLLVSSHGDRLIAQELEDVRT